MAFLTGLFTTIAAIPKMMGYCEQFAVFVSTWYMQRATANTLSAVADAANAQALAITQADRFATTDLWQKALQRERQIPG